MNTSAFRSLKEPSERAALKLIIDSLKGQPCWKASLSYPNELNLHWGPKRSGSGLKISSHVVTP